MTTVTDNKAYKMWKSLFVILAILALMGIMLIPLYLQQRRSEIEIYLNQTRSIIAKSNTDLSNLNTYFTEFKGDPASAQIALPKFKQAQRSFVKSARDLNALTVPKKAAHLHKSLVKFYNESSRICSDLASVANFILQRNNQLKSLSEDVKEFSSMITNAKTDEEIIKAAQDLKKSSDKTLENLRELEKPAILPYSNKALESYIVELSKALADLNLSIEQKNISGIQSAIERIKAVFQQNWVKAQVEEDIEGLRKHKSAVKEIKQLRAVALRERARLADEIK